MKSFSLNLFGENEDTSDLAVESSSLVKVPEGKLIRNNIQYKTKQRTLNTLDVLVPDGIDATQLLPVVIHIHGGGWMRGHKDHSFYGAPFMGKSFMERGFLAVVINYRKERHPKAARDVAAAINWVYQNIENHNGDKSKLFLSGHSAGAHLASLMVTDHSYLQYYNLDPSKIIKGVLAISGIYNVGSPFSDNEDDWTNSLYRDFYVNKVFGTSREDWKKASPYSHAVQLDSSKIPPFFICNATIDFGLDYDGKKLCTLLTSKGVKANYVQVCANHQSVSVSNEVIDHCCEFIYDVLSSDFK